MKTKDEIEADLQLTIEAIDSLLAKGHIKIQGYTETGDEIYELTREGRIQFHKLVEDGQYETKH